MSQRYYTQANRLIHHSCSACEAISHQCLITKTTTLERRVYQLTRGLLLVTPQRLTRLDIQTYKLTLSLIDNEVLS
jgi:hypothetical protein